MFPQLQFDASALARVRESYPATARFSVSTDEGPAEEKQQRIQVRSVNDVPYLYQGADGRQQDLSALFAAYVDENWPGIDDILHEALQWQAAFKFVGYQGSPEEVLREVFAIWNVLQRRQVRYSNITTPSSESSSLFSQHVRFLDESIQNSQANCVDGSVLFASVLLKIGLKPFLIIKPGHMFVGTFLTKAPDGSPGDPIFLETTLIGDPGLNLMQRTWKFLRRDGYKSSESYRQFLEAVSFGYQEFQEIKPQLNAHAPGYVLIDVSAARRTGISPIPRL